MKNICLTGDRFADTDPLLTPPQLPTAPACPHLKHPHPFLFLPIWRRCSEHRGALDVVSDQVGGGLEGRAHWDGLGGRQAGPAGAEVGSLRMGPEDWLKDSDLFLHPEF